MRKQEFGDPDTLACAAILVVQALRRGFVHLTPQLLRSIFLLNPLPGSELPEIDENLQLPGRAADIRRHGAAVQFTIRDILQPQRQRIVIHADNGNVYHIKLAAIVLEDSIQFAATPLHSLPQKLGKGTVLLQLASLPGISNQLLTIDIEHGLQQYIQGIARPQNPLRCQESVRLHAKAVTAANAHIQQIEQIDQLERFVRTGAGARGNSRLEGPPVIKNPHTSG